MRKGLWGAACAAVIVMLSACGSGAGAGGAIDGQSSTGVVNFTIKDAPLASLQTLTIDITGATLHGVGATANFQVFPQTSSPAFVQVDLLTLQGLGQLLASANVPVGVYDGLQIDYTNPQGTDFASVPQVITSPSGFMAGMFLPHLVVTQGSLQSVLIDVDLSTAYHDLGGNQGMLTPLAVLSLVGPGSPVPLQHFFGMVDSINTAQDSFDAHVFQWSQAGPPVNLGVVTVQCDAQTVFNDGHGGITVGNVTAQLVVQDIVEVDGVLTGGTIDADTVLRLGHSMLPQPPMAPPVQQLHGTIMDVNTTAGAITVRSQWNTGPASPPYTDHIVDVVAQTTIHRGPTALQLGDLVRGNYCHVLLDAVSGDAADIEEAPAYISGTVVSVSLGAGVGGANRIVFDPLTVNQIPIAQLPFVPSPLTVDIPAVAPVPQVAGPFSVFAFFDGTSTLVLSHASGGFVGLPPGPGPNPLAVLSGQLAVSTTATVNASGEVEFDLNAPDPMTHGMHVFHVTVPATANMTLFSGTMQPLATAQDAANAINAHPTALIQCVGTAPPVNYNFTADLELSIFDNAGPALPGPGPGPIPPPPVPGPAHDVAFGEVVGTAVINSAGDIEFTLGGFGPAAPQLQVTVRQTAILQLMHNGRVPTPLTVAQAVAELNQAPAPFVQVEGTLTGSTFDAHIALRILR